MTRWGKLWKIVFGLLPATAVLLPLIFAGGLAMAVAMVSELFDPHRSTADKWSAVISSGGIVALVAAAGLGVLSLWVMVLAPAPAELRKPPARSWLAIGLVLGLLAAAVCFSYIATDVHHHRVVDWAPWLATMLGPVLLGGYYLFFLLRR